MRPLIICEQARADLARVISHAENNRDSLVNIHARIAGKLPPLGDDPAFVCHLQRGFRVVFTIEEQPIGWCRHLSVSVDLRGKCPHPAVIEIIAKEFGFGPKKTWDSVWIENQQAVNVIEKIK